MHWYSTNKKVPEGRPDLGLAEDVHRVHLYAPAEMDKVLEKLDTWMRSLQYACKDRFAAKLALHEAALNAFHHGNCSDGTKWVRITFRVAPEEVLMCVEDQGNGFDPGLVADPCAEENLDRPSGRGLLLMRAYTDWLWFDAPGNRVTLCRRRSGLCCGKDKIESV